ncbi:hypothetical protein TgHK011_000952 [Trichoderma gracile]|nr:hypothetical protein TgHK011_000952 [Trichoderma gracile]
MGSSKKAPAPKKDQLATVHSASTALKTAQALQTAKATKTAGPAPIETGFTHQLPTKEQIANNGRKRGRNLILWQRPRMAEKLLHCLIYEIDRQGVRVNWDKIAHRLRPGSSGSSCKQYLNRSRHGLVAEGHVVAPLYKKNKTPDQRIRGYMRDVNPDDGSIIVRAVGYGEFIEDPKVNESDALEVMAEIKAQLEAEEASDVEGDDEDDFDFEDDITPGTCLTVPDDANIAMPPSPTPARHTAPRQTTTATEYAAEPQGLQLPAGQATLVQESIAPAPVTQVADISAANVWADNIQVSLLVYQCHDMTAVTDREQELQNFDAETLFQLGIGSDFANIVEVNSATQSPAPVTESPIPVTEASVPVTQSSVPVTQAFAPVTQTFAPVTQTFAPVTQTFAPVTQSAVAFTQASPETTSISQAPLELGQFSDLTSDTLFPELGAGHPFVLGTETLPDPFSVPASTQPYQTQVNPVGQYVPQQVQQQLFNNSWFLNNSVDLLQDQLFTPSQTNASISQYDFSMSSTQPVSFTSGMPTTMAPAMTSTMGPVMTPAFANVMTPAMTPSPEHKAAGTAAFTLTDEDFARMLQQSINQ